MIRSLALLLSAATLLPVSAGNAAPAHCVLPDTRAAYDSVDIEEDGLVARYLAPAGNEPAPGLIVLGGSEGGTEIVRALAEPFAQDGYAVLALSYFGADGLPDILQELPLGYFETALDWFAAQPGVDADRIGIYGMSKGGEAALLVASRDARLSPVVAVVPSHVVWQGINLQDFTPRSSWTADGKPLPFVPYEMSEGFTSIFALYDDALPVAADDPAIIPVETIAGPVLLISGAADTLWPSPRMADAVVRRLEEKGFDHKVRHLKYEEAGHGVGVPPSLGAIFGGPDSYVGGTEEGNRAGREAMWRELRCFLQTHLMEQDDD